MLPVFFSTYFRVPLPSDIAIKSSMFSRHHLVIISLSVGMWVVSNFLISQIMLQQTFLSVSLSLSLYIYICIYTPHFLKHFVEVKITEFVCVCVCVCLCSFTSDSL